MRLIDADAFRDWWLYNGKNVHIYDTNDILDSIDNWPTLASLNEPLTLEQLRQMDGQPVWVEDVEHWALIDIEKGGQWDGMPFATWQENGVRFCYNIINRNLLCYRRPPEKKEDTKDEISGCKAGKEEGGTKR